MSLGQRRSEGWISKSDVSRYFRCPYSWYLLERGDVAFGDTASEFQTGLIEEGNRFHARAEKQLSGLRITPAEMSGGGADSADSRPWLPTGVIENRDRLLYGIPDAVDPAGGAMFPMEFKWHAEATRLDRLELAFYWLVLEPYRTLDDVEPKGTLLLRFLRGVRSIEVPLRAADFFELDGYLRRIRIARDEGVTPRVCDCHLCSGPRRAEVLAAAREHRDVTLINGIGRMRAEWLQDAGIRTWESLLAADPALVQTALREHDDHIGVSEIERWRHHARAYQGGAPVAFGQILALGSRFIALDLEYTAPGDLIWLTGVAIVDGDHIEHRLLWALTAAQERTAMRDLAQIAAAHPDAPIVTWSGDSADIPALRAAPSNVGGMLDDVFARHVDLYQHAVRSHRWPIPELGLKPLSEHLGIARSSPVASGFEAQSLFVDLLHADDRKRRAALRAQLAAYCRDDLDCLVHIAQLLKGDGAPTQGGELPVVDLDDPSSGFVTSLITRIEARLTSLKDDEQRLLEARALLTTSAPPKRLRT